MARAKEEQRKPAGGITLIVMVGLAIAFLLYMALLNVIKSGGLWSETNLLFVTLIFYAGAGALYLAFGVTGTEAYVKSASLATWLGLIANTGAVVHRWIEAGHPPFTSVYEMLLSFVWMLAGLTLIAEKKYGVKVIGTITMPVAIVGVVLMQLLRTEVHPLVALLQSTWLDVHVTLAIMAYAACALSFSLAIMFLIQDGMKTETFLALTSASTLAIYACVVFTCIDNWGGLSMLAYSLDHQPVIVLFPGVPVVVPLSALGWLLMVALLVVAAPLVCYGLARWRSDGRLMRLANRSVFASILLQGITLAALLGHARDLRHVLPVAGVSLPVPLAVSAFIFAGLVGAVIISLLYLLLLWRRPDLERLLPTTDVLDHITYRTIGLAFPLLTLTIATGAYWANQTWGSYWSWDPKETWAAITWLVYALYLHMRITVGWRGRRAAYFAIAGFVVVAFTFFGVTYLLRGLHRFS
jgi:ABC-type transport system involved in cytochrome c biogenesis permease subunit